MNIYANEIVIDTIECSSAKVSNLDTFNATFKEENCSVISTTQIVVTTDATITNLNVITSASGVDISTTNVEVKNLIATNVNSNYIRGAELTSNTINCGTLSMEKLTSQNAISKVYKTKNAKTIDMTIAGPAGFTGSAGPRLSSTFKNGQIDIIRDYKITNNTVATFSDFQLMSSSGGPNTFYIYGDVVNPTTSIPKIVSYNPQISKFDNKNAYGATETLLSLVNSGPIFRTLRYEVNGKLSVYSDPNTIVWQSSNMVSDIRDKKNIILIDDPILKIKRLNGVYFNYIDESKVKRGGLIADEVNAVLPECIIGPTGGNMSVRYEKIIPVMIETIKKLSKELNSLN